MADAPTGDDAIALARAVLADAGDTGHAVVDVDRTNHLLRVSKEAGARSMRDRAAQEVVFETHRVPMAISEAISALPLLPDGGDTTEIRNGLQQVLRTDPAQEPQSDASQMLDGIRSRAAHDVRSGRALNQDDLDRARLLDMVDHLRAKHSEVRETSMRRGEQLARAEAQLRRQAATVHVATPEGITPCGEGHHDVTTSALIREATCLGCLRTLAQAPQDDLTEASQAAEHRHAPTACTDLGCLDCRVAQLEKRTTQVTDRLVELEKTTALESDLKDTNRYVRDARSRLDVLEAVRTEEDNS